MGSYKARWTHEETMFLIKLWKIYKNELNITGRKAPIWSLMEKRFTDAGLCKSAKQISKKLDHLKQEFRKESLSASEKSLYYNEIQCILGEHRYYGHYVSLNGDDNQKAQSGSLDNNNENESIISTNITNNSFKSSDVNMANMIETVVRVDELNDANNNTQLIIDLIKSKSIFLDKLKLNELFHLQMELTKTIDKHINASLMQIIPIS